MSSLQVPVVFPLVRGKKAGTLSSPIVKAKMLRSEFLGFNGISRQRVNVTHVPRSRLSKLIGCSFSSSSNDSGSTAENFNESDDDYVTSSVVEAVEMSSVLLMAAVRNVQLARPTMYQVLKEMVEKMGYTVKLVRVTKREHETYLAQLHLTKLDNDAESISFDLRPSDAINIAVNCKVPIQVNKKLAYSDGVRIVESADLAPRAASSDGLLFTGPDKPAGQPSTDEKEFILVRNMLVAAVEERYRDAALWRDKLTQLRSNKNWA
ncbi:bifunctional nuclease 2-like isoform X2 [Solanum tuberosum]|uniref:bifunctional nuclease 2-like isoform X2 n=1 Tax=Solanum tuberosum TaxID=4113 RepID=UPI0003D253DD|nr:PREDICTED: bifunctional nuclease 2-like isoform X2 [Solanum tuberosum]